jgi:hypothetical protein
MCSKSRPGEALAVCALLQGVLVTASASEIQLWQVAQASSNYAELESAAEINSGKLCHGASNYAELNPKVRK